VRRALIAVSVLLGQVVLAQAVAPPSSTGGGGAPANAVLRSGDTMTGPLEPAANGGAALGSSASRWSGVFAQRLDVAGPIAVNGTDRLAFTTATGRNDYLATVADGATAVGHVFDGATSLTTAGSRLLSVRNAGVEKFSVSDTGAAVNNTASSASQAMALTIRPGVIAAGDGFPAYGLATGPTSAEGFLNIRGGEASSQYFGIRFIVNGTSRLTLSGDGIATFNAQMKTTQTILSDTAQSGTEGMALIVNPGAPNAADGRPAYSIATGPSGSEGYLVIRGGASNNSLFGIRMKVNGAAFLTLSGDGFITADKELKIRGAANGLTFQDGTRQTTSAIDATGMAEAAFGVRPKPTTLTTCTAAREGLHQTVAGGGGALTKSCICATADGTAFLWVNLLKPTDRTGTATTCPAS
jgi:hypothetical protein